MFQSKEETTPLMEAILHNFKTNFVQPLSNCKFKLHGFIVTHFINNSHFIPLHLSKNLLLNCPL